MQLCLYAVETPTFATIFFTPPPPPYGYEVEGKYIPGKCVKHWVNIPSGSSLNEASDCLQTTINGTAHCIDAKVVFGLAIIAEDGFSFVDEV